MYHTRRLACSINRIQTPKELGGFTHPWLCKPRAVNPQRDRQTSLATLYIQRILLYASLFNDWTCIDLRKNWIENAGFCAKNSALSFCFYKRGNLRAWLLKIISACFSWSKTCDADRTSPIPYCFYEKEIGSCIKVNILKVLSASV